MMKLLLLMNILILFTSCGIQSLPQSKNAVEASLAEITNQYKRRADLIPNLVNTVKGYTTHEKETLESVVNARAKATQLSIDPTKMTASSIQKYQASQGELTAALGKLLVISERYPDLKADKNFRDLQIQLEGTENRIAVARNRYIQSIQHMNNLITAPPSSFVNSIFYKYEKMPQWEVSEVEKEKIQKVPEVNF